MKFDFNTFGQNEQKKTQVTTTKTGFDFNSFGSQTEEERQPSPFKFKLQETAVERIQKLKKEAAIAEEQAKKAGSFYEKNIRPLYDTLLPGVANLGDTVGGIVASKSTDQFIESITNLADTNILLLKRIREEEKKGKDTTNLKRTYNQNVDMIEDIKGVQKQTVAGADKATGQLFGELGMTGLNALTAGTYGKVTASMKTGQLAPIITKKAVAPSVVTKIADTVKKKVGGLFTKKGVAKVAEGAAIGEAYDVAQNLQEGKTGVDVLTDGYGKYIGAGIPTVLGASRSVANKVSEFTPELAKGRYAQNLNDIFKESTIGVKKISDFADDRKINLGEEIANRGFVPKVENDRLKFGVEPFDILDNEISTKSKIIDETVKQYPNTKIRAVEIKKQVTRQIANDPIIAREGRVEEVTKKATSKIDDFVAQTGREEFSLPEIQDFKKGMWDASKKFKLTEVGDSDAYSELGTLFRKIIEDEVPDVKIGEINKEIGKAQEVYKMLNKIDSLQGGGIVLRGGKAGRYAGDIASTVVGSVFGGAVGGPAGIVVGGVTTRQAYDLIRGLSQKSQILSILDRILIKYSKTIPDNPEVLNAIKFLDEIKTGRKPSITPTEEKQMQNIIKVIQDAYNTEVLMLPPPKERIVAGKKVNPNLTPEIAQINLPGEGILEGQSAVTLKPFKGESKSAFNKRVAEQKKFYEQQQKEIAGSQRIEEIKREEEARKRYEQLMNEDARKRKEKLPYKR